jgi:hypothetical protein
VRLRQSILIIVTLAASWLGMQAVHEAGHVLAAKLCGAEVRRVVLNPLTISRTDLGNNPHPLLVVWAGPVCGCVLPLLAWVIALACKWPGAFLLRFFAGFCLIANGAYIAFGSFDRVGDCGVMLQHGSAAWHLWMFGAATIPAGLALWHRQGPYFGLGPARGQTHPAYTCVALLLLCLLLALGMWTQWAWPD